MPSRKNPKASLQSLLVAAKNLTPARIGQRSWREKLEKQGLGDYVPTIQSLIEKYLAGEIASGVSVDRFSKWLAENIPTQPLSSYTIRKEVRRVEETQATRRK